MMTLHPIDPDCKVCEHLKYESFELPHVVRRNMDIQIKIVPQQNCPRCGGGEEFGNRTKVGHEDGTWSWRCYNPECDLRYWNPDWPGYYEDEPTPEEEAQLQASISKWLEGCTFRDLPDGSSQLVTTHGLSYDEWRETQ